ncbi:phosphatidylinositol synthase 1 (CDP-alcohol phosphatidyltransferase1) [Coemansia nantahalensis]|uniref:Phosphatidylinositol synthase 1 (CDP-alcohol phosphatidyltransferase1) n=1 Tax=Coemansia nantahalensis TaxID=2789366 RepID=A0ACC1K5A6_9FUNG|nr:phosphatidylinositol synthase 1 (CDP-alcohol phosphatidyltransferase1) [Coemansia nantahalensis]
MAGLTHFDVFWFVPNIIGYSRVALTALAVYCMYTEQPCIAFFAYAASELLDAADGYYARKLGQCSKFGEVLDMVTDRCTTTVLLTFLAQLYQSTAVALAFCFLISLDISSHYMQMYSQLITGKTNHKQMDEGAHWVLKAYYTDRRVLFAFCFGNEAFFLLLYLNKYLPAYGLYLSLPLTLLTFPISLIKNVINFIQLYESACDLARGDAADLNKAKSLFGAARTVYDGAPPPGQSGCEVPFGTVYTTINSTTFLLGLHSHTLVSGGPDLCRHGAQCSYYPYALQHVGLIASTLGASANFGQAALSSRDTEDRDVDNSNVAANASIATLSGDLFRGKDAPAHSSQATSSDKGAGSSSASDGAGSGGADDHSQRNAVIIAVCAMVGSLLLIGTAALLAMRHLRRKRLVPDPVAETRAQEILRVDRARASTLDYDLPPLYDGPRR